MSTKTYEKDHIR